ncbi:MAG: hypothetical protein IIA45_02070 [Bacteroidetes bacterium]|nr:hypothetical protein [Bacteroidota bacterium]
MDKLKARNIGASTALGLSMLIVVISMAILFLETSDPKALAQQLFEDGYAFILGGGFLFLTSWYLGSWVGKITLVNKMNAYVLGILLVFVLWMVSVAATTVLALLIDEGWHHPDLINYIANSLAYMILAALFFGLIPVVILGLIYGFIVKKRGKSLEKYEHEGA